MVGDDVCANRAGHSHEDRCGSNELAKREGGLATLGDSPRGHRSYPTERPGRIRRD
jgi:hypothetical protein